MDFSFELAALMLELAALIEAPLQILGFPLGLESGAEPCRGAAGARVWIGENEIGGWMMGTPVA